MSMDSELREERERRIAELEARLRRRGVGVRLWLVVEGERPGGDKEVPFLALLLVTFILANAALLIRGLRRKST